LTPIFSTEKKLFQGRHNTRHGDNKHSDTWYIGKKL
jgi:hypothetical protein